MYCIQGSLYCPYIPSFHVVFHLILHCWCYLYTWIPRNVDVYFDPQGSAFAVSRGQQPDCLWKLVAGPTRFRSLKVGGLGFSMKVGVLPR